MAHLLEESRRVGPADRDPLDAAGRRQGRPHRVADAASLQCRRRHQLRLPGRSHAAGQDHAAGRSQRHVPQARGHRQLAGVRRRLHPRGRQVRARPADRRDRRSRPAGHARDLRQGAPERADGKPVARALRRGEVGRSDPDRRRQGPQGRHPPQRLFLPGRMGPCGQPGQAERRHHGRRHPHPAEAGRRQGRPARATRRHPRADGEDRRRRGEAGLRRLGQARSRLRAAHRRLPPTASSSRSSRRCCSRCWAG